MSLIPEGDWRWWVSNTVTITALLMAIPIAFIHSKNVYIDLHNKTPTNTITITYKLLQYTMLCSLYCYIWTILCYILSVRPQLMNHCQSIILNMTWSYLLSKMFMYLTFIIRLYAVYNNPIFHYNHKTLKIICLIILTCTFSIAILVTLTSKPYPYFGTNDYIAYCHGDIQPIAAALTGLYDICLSIGSMIAFINPLRKVIKSLTQSTNGTDGVSMKSDVNKLMRAGMKYAILTSIATMSSLLLMVKIALGDGSGAPLDFVVNMVCMVLMTKYYNDKRVYERLCCGAIKCSYCCLGCCCGYHEDAVGLSENQRRQNEETVSPTTSSGQTKTLSMPAMEETGITNSSDEVTTDISSVPDIAAMNRNSSDAYRSVAGFRVKVGSDTEPAVSI